MDTVLKNLKDTYKRQDVLLPRIERHVLKLASQPSERRSDILHPSAMAKSKWCGREDFYRITGLSPDYKERPHSFRMENVFDWGHSIHRKYQRWLWEMDILWGRWHCKECKFTWFGTSPHECDLCHGTRLQYKEVPLESPELMIAGHADGVVENRILEIKTIGINTLRYEAYSLYERYIEEQMTPDELWFLIKRPFGSHIRQAMIYLHVARSAYPHLNLDEIIFLYEWKPTQEVKEFVVQYNPDLISRTLQMAADVATAVQQGTVPERPEWADIDGKVCGSCGYRNTCWGKDPEEAKPSIRVKRSNSARRSRALRSSS